MAAPARTPAPTVAPARTSAARERLLRTASALFYAEGLRAVGVDRVVEEASVTRATFYRHFPGKEQLVVAYLEAVDGATRARAGALPDDTAGAVAWLRDLTDAMADQACAPGFRGCAFINAAAEYPDAASPVRAAVREHRAWLRASVTEAFRRAGHGAPERAGERWTMLRDGAMVAGYLTDATAAGAALRADLEDLLASR